MQDVQVEALQRKAHEAEVKLKKQQGMYESVRSDRNMYSKNMVEVQEEIQVMDMTFRTLSHQVSVCVCVHAIVLGLPSCCTAVDCFRWTNTRRRSH